MKFKETPTHRCQAFAHKEMPVVIGKYANVFVNSGPEASATKIVLGPIRSAFILCPCIIRYLVNLFGVTDRGFHMHLRKFSQKVKHALIIHVRIDRLPQTEEHRQIGLRMTLREKREHEKL